MRPRHRPGPDPDATRAELADLLDALALAQTAEDWPECRRLGERCHRLFGELGHDAATWPDGWRIYWLEWRQRPELNRVAVYPDGFQSGGT